MRYVLSAILGLAAGAVCFVWIFPWGSSRDGAAPSPDAAGRTATRPGATATGPSTAATQRPLLPIGQGASWPMFRGNQSQQGRANPPLGDSLKLYWRFATGDMVKSTPAVADGLVFFGSSDCCVYAVEAATGLEKWRYKTEDGVDASPLVLEGTVYVGSRDNNLYALDARTGKLKWKFATGGVLLAAANWIRIGHKTCILVGSYDKWLYCLDTDGKLVWKYESENYINGSPAVVADKVIFGGCDAKVHVVAAADGTGVTIDAGAYIGASTAADNERVYVGTSVGRFLCVDAATRRTLWAYDVRDQAAAYRKNTDDTQRAFFSSAAIGTGRVLVGSNDKELHCLSRDGKRVWTFATSAIVDGSPVIVGEKVVLGGQDGRLYLLRMADGGEIWSYDIGSSVTSSPAVAGGAVFVGCEDGAVYALGAE